MKIMSSNYIKDRKQLLMITQTPCIKADLFLLKNKPKLLSLI